MSAGISAYIPCFNNEATLAAAIDGIRCQSVAIDDFFIVDDGSTDRSREIATDLGVRVIALGQNLGRGAVRASAMEEARHEYVLCCDATNRLKENFLAGALPWMEDAKVAGVIGRIVDENVNGAVSRWRARHLFHQEENETGPRRDSLSTWGTLLRKSAVLDAGNFDRTLRLCEDAELGRRLKAAGFDLFFDPKLIVATQARNTLRQVMERYFRWHRREASREPAPNFSRMLGYAVRGLAVEDLRAGDPAAALLSLLTPFYGMRHGAKKSLAQRLLTKPVWWLERHRPYPIRRAWTQLPPIRADQGAVPFVVLCTPPDFDDAMWCAWSWLRFIAPEVRLELHVDGGFGARESDAVARLFPGGAIRDARTIVAEATRGFPVVEDFCTQHKTGRKMALFLQGQKTGPLLYCDYDVLAFSPPVEILECLKNSAAGAFLQETESGAFDPLLVRKAAAMGLQPLRSFNAGLLVLQKNSLALEAVGEMIEGWRACPSWWLEQTVLACLLQREPMMPLPRERYILDNARQFYWQRDVPDYARIAARHFTTPTRHVMYLKGLPLLRNAARLWVR